MGDVADGAGSAYGVLERSGSRVVLRFERRFRQAPETVWRALTEPEHLLAWFPTTIEGARAAGAALRFAFPNGESEPFDGQMLAFEPGVLMELRWGPEILRFELSPDDGGTLLTFTDTSDELGKAARDGAGWHSTLDLLSCAAAGKEPLWSAAERWREVRQDYIERFGPQASTVGPPPEWEEVHGPAGR